MSARNEPKTYVVAVSGGVDSVVLLHLLTRPDAPTNTEVNDPLDATKLRFIVAHFDHGIRTDSLEDRLFVGSLAAEYKLPFVFDEGRLGPTASEAIARDARYDFLRRTSQASRASGIITAHHQDDAMETAILHIVRGTGRKGLSALQDTPELRRPLLAIPKQDIISYATRNNLRWREDSTNSDIRFRRNYVRHQIMPRFEAEHRRQFHELIQKQRHLNNELDAELASWLADNTTVAGLSRRSFNALPHGVAREVLASWLRSSGVSDFHRAMLERLTVLAKVSLPGRQYDVLHGYRLIISKDHLALQGPER